jgi:Subtilase family
MTNLEGHDDSSPPRRPTVSDVVAVANRGDGFAYVPGQVLARGSGVAARIEEETGSAPRPLTEREAARGDRGWLLAVDVADPLAVIDLLRAEGFEAQPNHVMFAHPCGHGCPPHPALVQELVENGMFADPMRANPMRANPMRANPMRANPMRANPMRANHSMESTALPALGRQFPERVLQGPGPHPTVIVLDTGLAGPTATVDHTAPLLESGMKPTAGTASARIRGTLERPDNDIDLGPQGIAGRDGYLDPAAGHGTFIAGIIEQLAPGCTIDVRPVIGPLGDAHEDIVATEIHTIVDEVLALAVKGPVIVNISFGGQVMETSGYLREAIARAVLAGIVIVASAGNDGLCTPQFPAAFPKVVAVAALGPNGPAPWTNYGDWVDACAPGTDLVSAFFAQFNGKRPSINGFDPDRFGGWAEWSGSSFAVPVVVAAIARELVCGGQWDPVKKALVPLTAQQAVDRVVLAPHLARLPCLGTVVNI